MAEHGAPISYLVLADGVPVLTADGARLGTVKRVLADVDTDIFDGLIVDTADGERFVDAPHVAELYERAAILALSAEQARELPDPAANPAVVEVGPDDTAKGGPADSVGDAIRRAWDIISGKY